MAKHSLRAKILYNKQLKPGFWQMGLAAPQIAWAALPGQFINVRVSDGYEPLLRRPFSIHKVEGRRSKVEGKVEILYEVVGEGSRLLSKKKEGEYLDVIGPLGNGFTHPSPLALGPSPILVAGGMGVAPLLFLAERILRSKVKGQRSKVTVLIGAKTKNQILCEKEFKQLGCEVKIATDDGSRGYGGKITELFKRLLRPCGARNDSFLTDDQRPPTIYGCGPRPMLKAVSDIAQEHAIPAQLSLEEHMGCGIGACMGCAVKVKGSFAFAQDRQGSKVKGDFEYKRVCKDGPVFEAQEIVWEEG